MNFRLLFTAPFMVLSLVSLLHCAAYPSLAQDYHYQKTASCSTKHHPLRVSLLNVGQGDAILIQCPASSHQVLIDAGPPNSLYPQAEKLLLKALRKRLGSDKKIELALNTHPHPDHIYGFYSLLTLEPGLRYSFDTYVDDDSSSDSPAVEKEIRQLVRSRGGKYINATQAKLCSLELCPKTATTPPIILSLIRLAPNQMQALGCPENYNDCGLVGRFSFQGISFLLLADASKSWEKEVLHGKELQFDLKSTVLKAGHHGANSTGSALLNAVSPGFVLLSSGTPGLGTTDKYGTPRLAVVERIIQHFANIRDSDITPGEVVQACSWKHDSCNWHKRQLPASVWSTAASGTIDMFVGNGQLCLESELSNKKILFTP